MFVGFLDVLKVVLSGVKTLFFHFIKHYSKTLVNWLFGKNTNKEKQREIKQN